MKKRRKEEEGRRRKKKREEREKLARKHHGGRKSEERRDLQVKIHRERVRERERTNESRKEAVFFFIFFFFFWWWWLDRPRRGITWLTSVDRGGPRASRDRVCVCVSRTREREDDCRFSSSPFLLLSSLFFRFLFLLPFRLVEKRSFSFFK